MFPENRNPDVRLRSMTEADLPFLLEVRNDAKTRYFLHDVRKFEIEDAIRWWDETNPRFYVITHCGEPVGYVRTSNWNQEARHVCVGADIHPDYRRRGFARAAYQHLLDYLFDDHNMHKVALEVLATNEGAIALYEQLGFRRDGVKRHEVVRDNCYVDSIIMSILNTEWWRRNASQGI